MPIVQPLRPTADAARFGELVGPEIEVLLRVARTLTRNGAEAEDLVQDTLLRAYRGMGGFDGRHPRAWVLTILRNTHINRNRRQRPELLRDPDRTMAELTDTGDRDSDVEHLVIDLTFDAVVEDALLRLPEASRRVVELIDVDGLSYAETAEALGIPVGTVMSRINRARQRIRDHLAGAGLAPRSTI